MEKIGDLSSLSRDTVTRLLTEAMCDILGQCLSSKTGVLVLARVTREIAQIIQVNSSSKPTCITKISFKYKHKA